MSAPAQLPTGVRRGGAPSACAASSMTTPGRAPAPSGARSTGQAGVVHRDDARVRSPTAATAAAASRFSVVGIDVDEARTPRPT